MNSYLRSRFFVVGLITLILGSGPLLIVILIATLGLYHDPNPNPVFLGILAGLTFWPSLLLIAVGVWRVRRSRERGLG